VLYGLLSVRRRRAITAVQEAANGVVDDSSWTGARRAVLCALCASPRPRPGRRLCDVIDDVTARRCWLRAARRRHDDDDDDGFRVMASTNK